MKPDEYLGKSESDARHTGNRWPSLLETIESQPVEDALHNRPGLLAALCRQLAAHGPFQPAVYHRFMKCYWKGVDVLVANSPAVRKVLANTMPLTVNLEATDTALLGHFRIREGTIHGGPEKVPFRDQDFRFFGPTPVLMMLLNNELRLGYADLSLHSEGHPGLGRILYPVMEKVAQLTKESVPAV